ncbi:MAG: oligoendopeptidase F, partial [Nitrosopumilales archaeon]|nr:oligoendopeptidase F [Nitrosopumilales archaeon]
MQRFETGKWDLSCLAKNPNSAQFAQKIQNIEKNVKQFEKIKPSLNPNIQSKKFQNILHSLEDISEKISMVAGYAHLSYAANTQSDEATSLVTKMTKLAANIENRTLFFDLWWKKKIDEKNAKRLIKDAGQLSNYLQFKRLMAKYSLSEPEEKIINTLDVTGISALVKLYDKITNAFEYVVNIDGKKRRLTREELAGLVRSSKPKTREAAYKTLLGKYFDNKGVLGEIYQNIVLNWKDEGIEIRGFSSPIS